MTRKRRTRSQPPKRRRGDQSESETRTIGVVLAFIPLLLLVFGVGVWLGDSPNSESAAAPAVARATATAEPVPASDLPVEYINDLSELPAGPTEHVQVTYFHRTHRCAACIEAEQLTRKALNTNFADRLQRGDMSLVVADVQAPQNAALTKEYGAWTSSLYLGVVKNGTKYILSLREFWFVLNSEQKFTSFLSDKIDMAYGGS